MRDCEGEYQTQYNSPPNFFIGGGGGGEGVLGGKMGRGGSVGCRGKEEKKKEEK